MYRCRPLILKNPDSLKKAKIPFRKKGKQMNQLEAEFTSSLNCYSIKRMSNESLGQIIYGFTDDPGHID